MAYVFGECEFDSGARRLTRAGRGIELSPKAFGLIDLLLASCPRAVSQGELRDRIWPGTYVGYTSLAQLVTEVRKAIGDDAHDPRFLRTIRGFGYAFAGEVRTRSADGSAAQASAFLLRQGDREISLREGENLIGREADCPVRLQSARVSRRHARIVVTGSDARLEDLDSKNGTILNGRPVDGPASLQERDEISVGAESLVFLSVAGPSSTETDPGRRR